LSGKCALLLFDGTEAIAESGGDLEEVLQIRGDCGVIVTSRRRDDAVNKRHELFPLEEDEAVKLLQAWGKDRVQNDTAARRICILVGRLPLAVRLAGRYLKETGETADEYLSWLAQTPLEALDQGKRRLKSVTILLKRSLSQVSGQSLQLLGIAGILALAPFGRKELAVALNRTENELRRSLNELVNYGLLLRRERLYEVGHALIHTYARRKITPPLDTVKNLAAYYTEFTDEKCKHGIEGYARLDGEREHIMRVIAACMEHAQWQAAKDLSWAIRDYLYIQGHLTEFVIVNQTGVDLARQLKDRLEEGAWIGNLGLAYRALGEVEKAIEYYSQALEAV
jgi:tetratricopeptide (TPR) repeat protein